PLPSSAHGVGGPRTEPRPRAGRTDGIPESEPVMKKVIAVVLVMGLVFGVTFITQFTLSDPKKKEDDGSAAMPLLFGSQEARRDPTSDDPHHRYFQGFYEKGAENSVLFWFRNENPAEVTFGFRGFS